VKLPKLYKEACPDCGDLNIFFDVILKIECKNCHFMITRGGPSVALDKEGCEIL
jgi:ribosomal protein L44E